MSEGFLEIINVDAPETAHEGELVNIMVTFENTGGADTFQYEFLNLTTGEVRRYEIDLEAGQQLTHGYYFTMPNRDVEIVINTYHFQEGTWIWDNTSVWDVDFWW